MPPLIQADAIVVTIVAVGTGTAAAIDLRTRRVPNALTATFATVGLGIAAAGIGPVALPAALLGCLIGAALMLPGHILGATGAGDVKLLAASGALLGAAGTFRAFLYTAIAGGLLALVVALRRRRVQQTLRSTVRLVARGSAETAVIEAPEADNRFAYAPAIAVGTVIAALGW